MQKTPTLLNFSFSSVRGIRTNFGKSAESFLLEHSLDILALCGNDLKVSISTIVFSIPEYITFYRNILLSIFSVHMHSLGVYVRENFPVTSLFSVRLLYVLPTFTIKLG